MATAPSADDPRLDPKRQILLHLDVGLIKDLKKAAVDLEVSASSLAGQAIDAWLREQGRRTTSGGDT